MALTACATCRRHHDPETACPFCAGGTPSPLSVSLGGTLLLSMATALGCVGSPSPAVPSARPALIDTLPTPPGGPTPTPTPATTYGLPPPRKRRRPT